MDGGGARHPAGGRAATARPRSRGRPVRHGLSRSGRIPQLEDRTARGPSRRGLRRRSGPLSRAHPCGDSARPGHRRGLCHRRDLPRHSARRLFGGDGAQAPASRRRFDGIVAPNARHQAGAGARRRQPEEHSGRAAGAGLPRRRMRLVRRSGVRPGVLPQPHAAEMPVDAVGGGALPRAVQCPGAELSRRRHLGAAGGDGAAHRASAARAFPRPGGRQVAGGIRHRGQRQGEDPPRRAGFSRYTRPTGSPTSAIAWAREIGIKEPAA